MPKAYSYIRFSTPEQEKGDSLRRQLSETRNLAAKYKLELDETLQDRGISARKGRNRHEGALGRFLARIETGDVKKGSWLIVESLDRISREDAFTAFTTLSNIVNAGITVATTMPEMVINREQASTNPGLLFYVIGVCARAHEESKTKAARLAKRWAEKRASGKPETNQCPAWLQRGEDEWIIHEDRVKVIHEMFAWSIEGHGDGSIAKKLNERREPTWGRKDPKKKAIAWHESYVTKILSGRTVLGEHQHYTKTDDGKRVPSGDVVIGYYPQIVDDETYYACMAKRKSRRGVGIGPIKAGVSNLFSGLMFCSGCTKFCGNKEKAPSVVHVDKGDGLKYLVCQGARLGAGCDYVAWSYPEFERMFLELVTQIDLTAIFAEEDVEVEKAKLDLAVIDGELAEKTRQMERLEEAIISGSDAAARLGVKLGAIAKEHDAMEETRRNLRANLTRLERSKREREANTQALRELVANSKDLESRHRLREQIRERIVRITVQFKNRPSPLPTLSPKDKDGIKIYFMRYVESFTVAFKTGALRTVQLWPTEPSKYMRGLAGQDAREQRWGGFRLIDVTESGIVGSPERVEEIEKAKLE